MDEFSDATPIATVEQFKAALLAVRDRVGISPKDLTMLKAHCRAPNHTITTTQLAKEIGYQHCAPAHLLYGALAHHVADALHYVPGPFSTGNPHWWRTLASGNDGAPQTEEGYYEWIMRPELVQALREMRWA
jgi:hypothetical protein